MRGSGEGVSAAASKSQITRRTNTDHEVFVAVPTTHRLLLLQCPPEQPDPTKVLCVGDESCGKCDVPEVVHEQPATYRGLVLTHAISIVLRQTNIDVQVLSQLCGVPRTSFYRMMRARPVSDYELIGMLFLLSAIRAMSSRGEPLKVPTVSERIGAEIG